MVVNRKQPAAPLQPVSRSSSTQPVPTKRQQPAKTQNGVHDIDSGLSKKSVPKSSKQKKIKNRSRPKTLIDRLFLISLSLFTFYAVYTCRPNPLFSKPNHTDPFHPNPLCRSLSAYHTHVLRPYIIPSVEHGLAFTNAFAEPYIAATQLKLSPYVAPMVQATNTVKPYVIRTANIAKGVWKGTLVPFYTGTLKPYYVKAVLPRYRMYIQPRLALLAAQASRHYTYYISRPLHIQSTRLQKIVHSNSQQHVQPYLNKVQPYVLKSYHTLHVAFFQTVDAYNMYIHPQLSRAWIQARPALCAAWKHAKRFSMKAAEVGASQLKFAIREAGGYRRTYVDPHVIRIWAKVTEGTEGAIVSTYAVTSSPPIPKEVPEPTVASIPEPTSANPTEATTTPLTETVEPKVENTLLADPAVPTPEEDADDIPSFDTKITSPPAVELEETALEVEELEPATAIAPASEPTPEPMVDDLDDFLKEMGLDDSGAMVVESTADVTTDDSAASNENQKDEQPKLSAEELAVIIAGKRAAIVERHEEWFVQLDNLIANESATLMETIEDWRKEKTTELAEMSGKNASNAGLVNDVQKEGERLIKGLEAYLRKAETRSSAWKVAPDASKEEKEAKKAIATAEKDKWEAVLSKVEAKFSERVVALQSLVHSWFVGVRQKEIQYVQDSSAKIKLLAETAQADLGLDYAWLEDTSYDDWQWYHDLMRAYEDFEQTAYALQNGTALPPPVRAPPADPIVPALDALHSDLQDVIMGFQVALGAVRSEAAKVFSLNPESAEDDEDGFFVVRDGEVRKDDLRDVDLGGLGLSKEKESVVGGVMGMVDEVKILPIGPGSGDDKKKGEELDMSTIFIGKDKVQVEQALGTVPLEPAASRHEEL